MVLPHRPTYRDRPGEDGLRPQPRVPRLPAPPGAGTAEEARARCERLDWPALPAALPLHPRYFPETTGLAPAPPFSGSFSSPSSTSPSPARCSALLPRTQCSGAPADQAPGGGARTWLVLLPEGTASAPNRPLKPARRLRQVTPSASSTSAAVARCGPTPARAVPPARLGFEAYNAYLAMLFDGSTVSWRAFDVARARVPRPP